MVIYHVHKTSSDYWINCCWWSHWIVVSYLRRLCMCVCARKRRRRFLTNRSSLISASVPHLPPSKWHINDTNRTNSFSWVTPWQCHPFSEPASREHRTTLAICIYLLKCIWKCSKWSIYFSPILNSHPNHFIHIET